MTVNAATRLPGRLENNILWTVRVVALFTAFCAALLANLTHADSSVVTGSEERPSAQRLTRIQRK